MIDEIKLKNSLFKYKKLFFMRINKKLKRLNKKQISI